MAIQLCDISIEYNPKEYLAYLKKGNLKIKYFRGYFSSFREIGRSIGHILAS